MTIELPILVTFIGYLCCMLLLGLYAYKKTNTHSDYILGGRSLNPSVAALSVGASDMSGWLLLGLPGAIYLSGVSAAWIGIGLVVGAALNWIFVAKRLRVYTEVANDSQTLPDFLSNRFADTGALKIQMAHENLHMCTTGAQFSVGRSVRWPNLLRDETFVLNSTGNDFSEI